MGGGPFDFLGSMANGLNDYFAPALSQAHNTLSQFFPSKSNNLNMLSSPKAPQLAIPQSAHAQGIPQPQQPQPTGAVPGGLGAATDFIKSQTPQQYRGDLSQYYPALQDQNFLHEIYQADQKRQGLANLLLLQAFFESTLGRGGSNTFGIKPGGNAGSTFASPEAALQYQMGPAVLGGGVGGKLNILNTDSPLTTNDISSLYDSYNPNSPYVAQILKILGGNKNNY